VYGAVVCSYDAVSHFYLELYVKAIMCTCICILESRGKEVAEIPDHIPPPKAH
jgi:hypothetical protein